MILYELRQLIDDYHQIADDNVEIKFLNENIELDFELVEIESGEKYLNLIINKKDGN